MELDYGESGESFDDEQQIIQNEIMLYYSHRKGPTEVNTITNLWHSAYTVAQIYGDKDIVANLEKIYSNVHGYPLSVLENTFIRDFRNPGGLYNYGHRKKRLLYIDIVLYIDEAKKRINAEWVRLVRRHHLSTGSALALYAKEDEKTRPKKELYDL